MNSQNWNSNGKRKQNEHGLNAKLEKGMVSIIIPAFNAAEFIRESISSALGQDYEKKEVIVIDDGSTDNTQGMVQPFLENIDYYYKANGGPASARNVGIRMAKGEYIAFLDADDTWSFKKLTEQVDYLSLNLGVDVVFTLADNGESDVLRYSTGAKQRIGEGEIFYELLKGNFIVTSTVMVRRSVFFSIGLFDEDKFLVSVEDINMWLRMSRLFRFGFIDQVLSRRRLHKNSLTEDFERMFSADLYNYEKIATSYPKLELKKKRAYYIGLSNYCFGAGDSYFYKRDYKNARKVFLLSIRYNVLHLKAWVRLGIAFLPTKLINTVRKKRRFFLKN
jgi:glycosyltransferase involved in cell wall biosynthesis